LKTFKHTEIGQMVSKGFTCLLYASSFHFIDHILFPNS
jgi:hypothetical protein